MTIAAPAEHPKPMVRESGSERPEPGSGNRKRKEEEERQKAAADSRRRDLERQVQSAERDLERAVSAETSARERLERTTEERRKAEAALASLRAQLD